MNADDPHCNGGSRWSYQVIASVLSLCFKWNNPSRSHAHFPLQNKIQPWSIIKSTRHIEVCFQCWFGKTPKKNPRDRGVTLWLRVSKLQHLFLRCYFGHFCKFLRATSSLYFSSSTITIITLECAGPTTLYFVRLFSWFIKTFRTFNFTFSSAQALA